QRALARVGVDAQCDDLADVGQRCEGRERDEHFVADATHVDQHLGRGPLEQHPLEPRDHRAHRKSCGSTSRSRTRGRGRGRRTRSGGPARAWQIAAASASAASIAGALASPSTRFTIRCIWSLGAFPLPATACLIRAGAYCTSGIAAAPSAASTAPRACPSTSAERGLAATNTSSTLATSGAYCAITAPTC